METNLAKYITREYELIIDFTVSAIGISYVIQDNIDISVSNELRPPNLIEVVDDIRNGISRQYLIKLLKLNNVSHEVLLTELLEHSAMRMNGVFFDNDTSIIKVDIMNSPNTSQCCNCELYDANRNILSLESYLRLVGSNNPLLTGIPNYDVIIVNNGNYMYDPKSI